MHDLYQLNPVNSDPLIGKRISPNDATMVGIHVLTP